MMVFMLVGGFAPPVLGPIYREKITAFSDRFIAAQSLYAVVLQERELMHLGVVAITVPPTGLLYGKRLTRLTA
jgi:hypothetical protein